MHEKVREYLEAQRAAETNERALSRQKEKQSVLLDAGLYDKVYAPEGQKEPSEEYPIREMDRFGRQRFYRAELYEVTEEEYEEIRHYVQASKRMPSLSPQLTPVESKGVYTPRRFFDLQEEYAVAIDVRNMAHTIKAMGVAMTVLALLGGLVMGIVYGDALVAVLGFVSAVTIFVTCWFASRLMHAVSAMAQSSKTTADAILYKISKEE